MLLRHRFACSLEFWRYGNVYVRTSMRTFDPNATISNMLRTETHYFTTPRNSLKSELQNETLLCSE